MGDVSKTMRIDGSSGRSGMLVFLSVGESAVQACRNRCAVVSAL